MSWASRVGHSPEQVRTCLCGTLRPAEHAKASSESGDSAGPPAGAKGMSVARPPWCPREVEPAVPIGPFGRVEPTTLTTVGSRQRVAAVQAVLLATGGDQRTIRRRQAGTPACLNCSLGLWANTMPPNELTDLPPSCCGAASAPAASPRGGPDRCPRRPRRAGHRYRSSTALRTTGFLSLPVRPFATADAPGQEAWAPGFGSCISLVSWRRAAVRWEGGGRRPCRQRARPGGGGWPRRSRRGGRSGRPAG